MTSQVAISEEFRHLLRQEAWVYSPPKPKVQDAIRAEVGARATELVRTVLKPEHVV